MTMPIFGIRRGGLGYQPVGPFPYASNHTYMVLLCL
jgi:hypothetical protein